MPNGIAYRGGWLYVADSVLALVWWVHSDGQSPAEIWAADPLLLHPKDMSGAAHTHSAGHPVGGPRHVGAPLLEQDVRRDAQSPMQAPAHGQGERALAGEHVRSMTAEIRFEVLET